MAAPQPPPGLDLTENRSPHVTRVVVPVAVLSTLAVACRLFSRKLKKLNFAAHDYLIIAGLILAWGCAAETITMAHYGMGKHVYVLTPGDVTNVLKTLFSFIFIFDTAIVLIKASILLFYRYLFPVKSVTIALWVIGFIVAAWWFLTVFMGLFLCTPVAAQWNKTIPNAKCISNKKYYIATAVPNTVTDLAMLLIPIIKVWQLQMPMSQRILICGIFLVGIFECAVSIVRIVYLFNIGTDITWDVTDGAIWGSIEPSVGVICACLPTMLPFFDSFIFKPLQSLTSSIQDILRPSAYVSDDGSPSMQTDAEARKWHRMQEGWPANSTFAKGEPVQDGMRREGVGSQDIGIKQEVDVVGTAWHNSETELTRAADRV